MKLNRLNIGVNLCLLMRRPWGSIVLKGSCIISAPGILWRSPPVHISCGRHWMSRSLLWNLQFLLSGIPEVVWWWLILRKPWLSVWHHSVSWPVCLLFVLFPQSRCYSLAFRTSVFLHLLLDLDTYGAVDPLGVFHLFLKKVADIITPKFSILFCRVIRLGSFLECWRSANVTVIPKSAPSPAW